MLRYEDYEREKLDAIYDTVVPYSQMSKAERYFLNGIIRGFRPKKILEAGVAHGGSSAIILNAIQDIDGAELYSVDYSMTSWKYPDKPSGFIVEEKFPAFMEKWHIFRGGDVSAFIEEIGGDIDLFLLDTVHTHPWETLNFLCVLPFMRKNSSWLVLHDISLFLQPDHRHELANLYLYSCAVSDEKITPDPGQEFMSTANMGAFKVSQVTSDHADNLFHALMIPWNMKVPEKDLAEITKIVKKYYSGGQYDYFCHILDTQEYMFSHPRTMFSKLKGGLQQKAGANLYSSLQKFRRSLRRFGI